MKLLHLLYDFCNLYGEYGNILALERTLKSKTDVTTDRMPLTALSGELDFSEYDFIYIGSATERNLHTALEFLRVYKQPLKDALDKGTVILATGNAFELFGKSINSDGKELTGLGFFDYYSVEGDERIVTDEKAIFNKTEEPVIGFINKCSNIYGITSPMFTVSEGTGNNPDDKGEGIISGSFYGTHIIGPLLIRNPKIAEYFAETLIETKPQDSFV